MYKILQTEVDEKAVAKIDEEISHLNYVIEDTNRSIEFLQNQKRDLQVTYFCGKEIDYEHEEEYSSGRLEYELILQLSRKCRVKTRAYTSAHDMVTFIANIEGGYEISDIKFNIKTFDEAKQICRQWLADLIHDKFNKGDINE